MDWMETRIIMVMNKNPTNPAFLQAIKGDVRREQITQTEKRAINDIGINDFIMPFWIFLSGQYFMESTKVKRNDKIRTSLIVFS